MSRIEPARDLQLFYYPKDLRIDHNNNNNNNNNLNHNHIYNNINNYNSLTKDRSKTFISFAIFHRNFDFYV